MALPRVSGSLGNQIDLNVTFYRNGVPTDPFAIRRVEIHKSAVQEENMIVEFPVLDPDEDDYPLPITKPLDSEGTPYPGRYNLIWDVPDSGIPVPDIFFDVWYYISDDPGVTDLSSITDDELLSCCNEFWLKNDGFFCDNGLTNCRWGFEPLDIKFNQPEVRTIEVGLMPLPLYDYDYNKCAAIVPHLQAYFSLKTDNCELLINRELMRIGLRQGTYRSNPFTLQYTFDTRRVLRGSYQYQILLCLPNGETRASPHYALQVA
jgi:hypothetical protein